MLLLRLQTSSQIIGHSVGGQTLLVTFLIRLVARGTLILVQTSIFFVMTECRRAFRVIRRLFHRRPAGRLPRLAVLVAVLAVSVKLRIPVNLRFVLRRRLKLGLRLMMRLGPMKLRKNRKRPLFLRRSLNVLWLPECVP